VIRLQVDRLPGTGTPKPLWLWHPATATTATQLDRLWQAFLPRFDLEHTFRFLKQTIGWTTPASGRPRRQIDGPGWSSRSTPNFGWRVRLWRPTASLGTHTGRTCRVVPGPGPTGISPSSTGDSVACQRTEILPARSWTPSRITKRPPSPTPRPRQDPPASAACQDL
jgi:hypothetical protein